MNHNATQALRNQAGSATQALAQVRANITDSFTNDYVVGASSMEKLIAAQHSVHYWAQIIRIIERAGSAAGVVQGLREWATHTTDTLLECGRSSSTSMISNVITLSQEDELKLVLQHVRGYLSFVDQQS